MNRKNGIGLLNNGTGKCGFRALIGLASRLWGTAFEIYCSFCILHLRLRFAKGGILKG